MADPSGLRRFYWWLLAGWRRLLLPVRRAVGPWRVRHLAGPRCASVSSEDLVVVCMVRDGEPWIRDFILHYRNLGAAHFVFLDNGSIDDTKKIIREAGSGITLLETHLSFLDYKPVLTGWASRTFAGNGWVLVADIDELFDYPFSSKVGLRRFLRYLNDRDYSGVLVQMLDMFADQSPEDPSGNFVEECRYYEIESIRRLAIETRLTHHRCTPSNPEIRQHYGGVQERVFGTPLLLSKIAMFRPSKGARLADNHWCVDVRLADVSCVTRHFKFVGDLHGRAVDAVRRRNYWAGSMHYRAVKDVIDRGGVRLVSGASRIWRGVDSLVEEGFLVVSEDYGAMTNEAQMTDGQ